MRPVLPQTRTRKRFFRRSDGRCSLKFRTIQEEKEENVLFSLHIDFSFPRTVFHHLSDPPRPSASLFTSHLKTIKL
jgi:hypothetical protein